MKRSLKIAFAIAVILTILGMGQSLYAQPAPKSQKLPAPIARTLPAPTPPAACCSITAINTSTGLVTAKENATGKIFQFKVTNAALLNSLKIGQGVYANFATGQVSLDGSTMCCSIVPPAPPPPLPPANSGAGARTGAGGSGAGGPILERVTPPLLQPAGPSGAAPAANAAQAPAISPVGGTFFVQDLKGGITIADSTTGAVIHYTADGSTPTTSSTKYSGPIPVSSTTTIKAIATASGMTNSTIAIATYTIVPPSCPAGSVLEGVDVSQSQGTIDWKKVRASGRTFAYALATGGTNHVNPTFAQNYAAIKAAGLLRGAYHTFDVTADPIMQADVFISTIGTLQPGDLPPALDVGPYSSLQSEVGNYTFSMLQGNIIKWLTRVQAETGRTPIVYLQAGVSPASGINLGPSENFLWIPNYGVTCPSIPLGTQWEFWQYSGTGTVPGIPGAVDLNRFNGTLADLKSLANSSTSHKQASSATGPAPAVIRPVTPLSPATTTPQPTANQPATGLASTSSAAKPSAAPMAAGQIQNKVAPATPCCSITGINASTGVVTATESATGKFFQFKVADSALLNSLKAGQGVYANFGAGQVSVDNLGSCCNIVNTSAASSAATSSAATSSAAVSSAAKPSAAPMAAGQIQNKPTPLTPCCNIIAVNTNTGVVTAKENATGKNFQFKVADSALLNSLKVGQDVYANFAANVASLDGLSPSGIILSAAAAPAAISGTGVGAATASPETLRDEKTTKRAPGATSDAARPAGSAKTLAAADPSSVVQNIRQLGALPQLSYGTPRPAPSGPRGMPARWEASGTYMHLRGFDGIEQAQGIPEGVKTLLKIHVMALEPGEPDHYLVNPQLALEWSKTHPVPPEVKPPSTSDGHSGCSAWSIHCAGEVVKHAQDETSRQAQMLRQQAQADWKHWGTELTKDWHEADGCLADNTLALDDIPIEFAASPSVGIHLERSGKTTNGSAFGGTTGGSASGKAEGTVNLALPMNSPDFRANLEVFYIPCLPFMVRPKSIGGHGTVTVGSRLTAAVKATGQFDENISVRSAQLPIVLIPIVLFGVPIAEMQVSAYVEGNIEVSGQGAFTANFELDNPHEMKLEFSCSGHGCTGRSMPVAVPTTATETAQLNGRIRVEPTIFTAVQLDFDFGALTARAGPQPYLLGEIYGCVGAAVSQNLSSGSSTAQEWHGLMGDVDWGVDLRGQVLMGGDKVFDKTLHGVIKKNTHIWFKDLWPGGSNALYPLVDGAAQASMSTPALYQIKMPACYPYPDKVKYQLAWTGGATASMGASGTNVASGSSSATLATRSMVQQGARLNIGGNSTPSPSTSTSAPCNLQSGQGTCEFDPVKSFGIDLLWPVAGANNVAVTAVSDTHGREYKSAQPTSVNVTVQ